MVTPDILRVAIRHTVYSLMRLGILPLEEFNPGMGLEEIKGEYSSTLYSAMAGYLESEKSIVSFRNEVRRAVNDAFTLAYIAGWADAGASGELPLADRLWLNDRIEKEIGFADGLFAELKSIRADSGISQDEKYNWCRARASGYTGTLDGIYAQGKMKGNPYKMGTWRLGGTKEHCDTCAMLDGQEHPVHWFIDNGYIPQERGSATLQCGGWHCECRIEDIDGNQIIP